MVGFQGRSRETSWGIDSRIGYMPLLFELRFRKLLANTEYNRPPRIPDAMLDNSPSLKKSRLYTRKPRNICIYAKTSLCIEVVFTQPRPSFVSSFLYRKMYSLLAQ